MDYTKLADLLLPDTVVSTEEILAMYSKRNLPANAKVTRFAPSPTGNLHMGGLFAALISERLAHQSRGIFYLRVEDTDKKREVKGSIPQIFNCFEYFDINFDEGEISPEKEIGNYGPYKQSKRKELYKAFVKKLLSSGMAYPCFCSTEDLERIRIYQKTEKQLTGYYGNWAKCRNLTSDEIQQNLSAGIPFIIRLKSPGSPDRKIVYKDLVKGEIRLPENTQDIVILKSDGLPTYHFAHVVDDHLMGTTHVFRGDEWLSSVPVHLQLFELMRWNPPFYGHISPIMKMDGISKRKFSKRRDPEFSVSWFQEQGYKGSAVTEYLLTLANSNFEEWHLKNPHEPNENFTVTIEKLSSSGALFDINKFNDVCRNVVAKLSSDEIYTSITEWSDLYDKEFHDLIVKYKEYTIKILSIGRGSNKPRKDFANWSHVKPAIFYFYDELFDISFSQNNLPDTIKSEDTKNIIRSYIDIYNSNDDNLVWFEKIKELCDMLGYARDMKSFKKNPSSYKGHVGDVTMVLRVTLTGSTNTPDLFEIMQIMGVSRVIDRLEGHL